MNIDQAIRRAIKKSGQTRYAIAKGAEVDYAALTRYLDQEADLRLSTVEKLAAYLGVKVSLGESKQ